MMIDNINIYLDINLSDFVNKTLTEDWDKETNESVDCLTGEIIRVVSKYIRRFNFLKIEYNVGNETLGIQGSWNKQIKKHNVEPQSIEENMILVNELSNLLGIDISDGNIMYLECGINIIVNNNPENYINILDQHVDPRIKASYFHKNETKSFDSRRLSLKFYNKSKEMLSNKYMKYNIPIELDNKNILRYEIRYISRIKETFRIKETSRTRKSCGTMFDLKGNDFLFHTDGYLKVKHLYNVGFWNSLLLDLEFNYFSKIKKKPVFQAQDVKTKKDFIELLSIKALCDLKARNISIFLDEKKLSKSQKYLIRNYIKDVNSSIYTTTDKLELELDAKIGAEISRLRNLLSEYNDLG